MPATDNAATDNAATDNGDGVTLTLQHALILLGAALVLAVYLLSLRQYPRAGGGRKAARGERVVRISPPFISEFEFDDEEGDGEQGDDEHEYAGDGDGEHEHATENARQEYDLEIAGAESRPAPRIIAAPAHEFRARKIEGFERLSQVDYWVKIFGARDVGRESALAIFHENAGAFSMPRSIHGIGIADNAWRNLEEEAEGSRFGDLVVTIQLADRNGAVTPREMMQFSELVSRLSEITGREFSFMAPVKNAIAQSRVIADFIAHFDSVFALRIRPRGAAAFDGAELHHCAQGLGLESARHHYVKCKTAGDGGQVALYTLIDAQPGGFNFENIAQHTAREVIFRTRPAHHAAPGAVFAEMAAAAGAFAARMDGVAGALDGEELSQAVVNAQRARIERAAAEMASFGIPPGCAER
ncbi:MAG: hypothetical protein OD918_06305 [Gammaproteobacteria bacterium]